MTRRAAVSWPGTDGERLFGRFVRWDGDYAVTVRHKYRCRIHRSNLTFEKG